MVKKFMPAVIIVAVVLAVAAGYVAVRTFMVPRESFTQVQQERTQMEDRTRELEQQVESLERELALQQPAAPDNGTAARIFDQPPGPETPAADMPAEQLERFFTYLDEKGYLRERGITTPPGQHLVGLVSRLVRARPVIVGETKDMYTMLKNLTYLYRVLGKENLLLLRQIVDEEPELVEPGARLLFEWVVPWNEIAFPDKPAVPLDVLYEYSAFFLNTIGGQTYLYRRGPAVRLLVTYYSLLVLHRANQAELNSYGIDIRPLLDGLIREMESYLQLRCRDIYLDRLHELQRHYAEALS